MAAQRTRGTSRDRQARRGPRPPPRAVLLDALGTLVHLLPPAPALRVELSRLGVAVSEEEAGVAIAAEIAYYRAHHDLGRDQASLARLRRRCAEVLRDALPPPAAGTPVAAVERALLASLRFERFPDAEPALRALRSIGVRLVVVSNWDVSLHGVLARTGLSPLIDGAITSAELGAGKPEPAIFHHALGLAGVPSSAAWHVGDTPAADVAGARAAGIVPVLLDRDGSGPAPAGVTVVRSLAELPALAA